MDPLYNADGNAKTDVSPFMKCLRTLDTQDARFVLKDPAYSVHRCTPQLSDLPTQKVFFQGRAGVSTTGPLNLLGPLASDGKVAARPRLSYC